MPHIHDKYDFTVSAYIMHPTEPRICLHYHKKYGIWIQPGGHIELHEDPVEALIHELEEEAGLTPSDYTILEPHEQPTQDDSKVIPLPISINSHAVNDTHSHIDMAFLVQSKTEILHPQPGESSKIAWFTRDEVAQLRQNEQIFKGVARTIDWVFDRHLTR